MLSCDCGPWGLGEFSFFFFPRCGGGGISVGVCCLLKACVCWALDGT